jgi:hypothetical protein
LNESQEGRTKEKERRTKEKKTERIASKEKLQSYLKIRPGSTAESGHDGRQGSSTTQLNDIALLNVYICCHEGRKV